MLPGQVINLDHADDRAGYVAGDPLASFSHEYCNKSAGGRKGNRIQRARRNYMKLVTEYAAFGIEISQDRHHTAVVAAQEKKAKTVVELAGYLVGSDTAPEIAAFLKRQKKPRVVIDPRSPAAKLIDELEAQRITIHEASPKDVAVAHGLFIDELRAGKLRHVENEVLTAAIRSAQTRPLLGGLALERRKPEVDQSPAVAAELAVWGLLRVPVPRPPRIYCL